MANGQCLGRRMGFDYGLESTDACFPRKYRWLLKIDDVSADGINSLPPLKSARPNISFKEHEAQHLSETVYFPVKPEWKPINLTLYELKKQCQHPVFEWIKEIYDPSSDSSFKPSCDGFKKPQVTLELYDGCGNVIETWIFEAVWVQAAEFGDLDMGSSEVLTCDVTLRFDRAYIKCANTPEQSQPSQPSNPLLPMPPPPLLGPPPATTPAPPSPGTSPGTSPGLSGGSSLPLPGITKLTL
jgi:hypothetical protein